MNTVACELCGTQYAAGLARCPSCGTGTAAPVLHLPAGTRLRGGRFTVGRVLGQGGFGITYKGSDTRLRRPVAVKELFPEFALRTALSVTVPANRRADFQREQASVVREAQALAGLEAPGIVGVYDFFEEHGTAYIVMEYLEGPTLETEIEHQGGRLPAAEVVQVAEQACAALSVVHGAGLLHRDVKPANILLARNDRVVLLDFGSARAYEAGQTQRHTIVVTPDYAAPEQFGAKGQFGPPADLFCLGATLYHALTGAPPPSSLTRLQAVDATVSLPPSVPEGLRQAVEAALHIRIQDRPQSAAEFRALLEGGTTRPSVRPSVRAAGGSYRFRGRRYHAPEDVVAALCEDWDVVGIDARDKEYGATPLHWAAREGSADAVKAVLDAGARVDTPANGGWTPLHWAAFEGHADTSRMLLDAGADIDAPDHEHGATPLHGAVQEGNVDVAQMLLDAGACVDTPDHEHGATPLHRAAQEGNVDIARMLLDAGARVDAPASDGRTPLHMAALVGHADVVRVLLDAGASVNARNKQGWTPLRMAAEKGHANVSLMLQGTGIGWIDKLFQ